MVELCRDLNFLKKPLRAERRSQLRAQHFDGHFAVVLQVLGKVHGGHATGANLPLDGVAFLLPTSLMTGQPGSILLKGRPVVSILSTK